MSILSLCWREMIISAYWINIDKVRRSTDKQNSPLAFYDINGSDIKRSQWTVCLKRSQWTVCCIKVMQIKILYWPVSSFPMRIMSSRVYRGYWKYSYPLRMSSAVIKVSLLRTQDILGISKRGCQLSESIQTQTPVI